MRSLESPDTRRFASAHVLGFGTISTTLGTIHDPSLGSSPPPPDTHFRRLDLMGGGDAVAQFDLAGGLGYTGQKVPVENDIFIAGAGTLDSHWRDSIFGAELMTGFIDLGSNPLSAVTAASFKDLGYVIDEGFGATDPYTLPGAPLLSIASTTPGGEGVALEDDIWEGPLFGATDQGTVIQLE